MKPSPAGRSLVRSSRVFTLWMILMLAFAMLPAPDATAQTPTPTATPEGEQQEEEEEAGPTPTNTVVASATAPTMNVIIRKRICPPGTDPELLSNEELFEDCDVDSADAMFFVSSTGGTIENTQRLAGSAGPGTVNYAGVPFGTVTIAENSPAGYGASVMNCAAYASYDATGYVGDASAGVYRIPYNAPAAHQLSVTFDANDANINNGQHPYFFCYWYNFPPADGDGEGGNVYVNKFLCPPDFDYAAAGIAELGDECNTPQENVAFNIPFDVGGADETTNSNGVAEFEGIPFGDVTVREIADPAYLPGRAYCYVQESGFPNGLLTDDAEVPISTATEGYYSVAYDMPEGYNLNCYFYNVPADENGAALEVEDGETGTVEVQKYICHPDYDPSSADLDELLDNCTEPHEGAGINLFLPDEATLGGGTNANGEFRWEDVRAGPITLREMTEGYALVRVYCHAYPAAAQNSVIAEYEEEDIYRDGEFYHADTDLPADFIVHCYLFNTPTDYGTVYVYKYVCLPDFEYEGASREDLEANCTEPQENVSFGVGAESAPYQQERSTDSSGFATWDNVPAGGIGILESENEGYVLTGVYCGVAAQNNATLPESWEEATYLDGLEYHLPAGEYVHCIFYNAPDPDHGSIVITKYLCGPISIGIGSGDPDYDIFSNQCADIGVGYSFTLATSGGDLPGDSDDHGEVRWTGLDAGDVTITKTLPAGYGSYGVFCTTDPDSGIYNAYTTDDESTFGYTVVGGETLYCSWFNAVPDSNTNVEVVKYLCGPDVDYETADYPALSAACAETISDVPFVVYNASGYNSTKSTDEEGTAVWGSVTAGTISIQETPGPDYLPVKVYCSISPIGGTETGVFQGYDLDSEDHFIQLGIQDGESLVCHWFDTPVEVGTVVIYKYTCDLFFTRGGAGFEDYAENCTTPGDGFSYSLYDAAPELVDEQSTGPDGIATLSAPEVGTYSIEEEPLPDYQTLAVYCTSDVTTPPTTPEDSPPAVDLTPGATLTCYWFNVFYEAPPYDPGSIVIHKFECPPGYPTEPGGGRNPQNHFFLDCQVPTSGVNFNAEQGGVNVGSGETDATGTAIITGVSPGTTRISELPREGYGPPKIFCASFPTTGPTILFSYDEQTVDNWGHSYDLVEDDILKCYWFNFPASQGEEGQPIQIIVRKYLCEAGYLYSGQTYETISTECATTEEGVNFDVFGGDGATSGGPTDANGYAEYNGVVPGGITITETPRQGYQTLAVYCTNYVTTAGTPSLFPSQEGQLNYYLADGYTLECYWFNSEVVDHGHVSLFKYVCHEDYDYESASRDDLWANCTEVLEGVDFTLSGPGGYSEPGTTNADGEAGWEEVRPETYSLTETPPAGYYPVRIFCTEVPINGPFPYDPAFSGTWEDYTASPDNILDIELEVRAGYWLWCEWYNAPEPEYGTVHVYKYYCPEDYDFSTASRDDLYAACTQPHEGVEYHLNAADYAESRTTDTAGLAQWEEVPAGSASITEDAPEGYQPVRVYCGEAATNSGTLPVTWQDFSFGGDWTITYTVPANYYVTCEWYNAPYEEDPPQVWIQKYNCPEEADWHWSYHQFLSNCHEPGANVEYGIGPDADSLSLSVTNAQGRIILGDLDPGTLVIQEPLPTGYGGFVVFCQFVYPGYSGPYQLADVHDQSIQLHLEDGYVVTCVWFNLLEGHQPPLATPPAGGHQPLQPASSGGTGSGGTGGGGTTGGGGQTLPEVDPSTPATLIITKYTCEPDYDVHLDESDPTVDCDTLTGDIPFELSSEEEGFEAQDGLTGDDGEGRVSFSDLPAGPYLLTEELPEGTIAAFIYTCESDRREFQEENPFTPFAYAGPDGRLGVTLVPGETLECDWYDVPEDVPGGQVTVIKFACPGASVIVAQCEIFPDGATIGLFPVGDPGEIVELTTGEDGTVTAMVEGTYTVQELPTTACLIDSDAFDQEGNLVVNEGDEVEVRVYNCGLGTEEGQ